MAEPTDYDGAWKEALELYSEPFLRLCFPVVGAGIDWLIRLPEELAVEFRHSL